MKILRASDYKNTSWKNGLGVSSEIEIYPPDVDFATSKFLWRISSAKVSGDHLFSVFPEYERLLAVLSGGALELRFENQELPPALLKPFSVFKLSGTEIVNAVRRGNEIIDLGVIYDARSIDARMTFEQVTTETRKIKFEEGLNFLIFIGESLIINENDVLKNMDSAKVTEPTEMSVRSSASSRIGRIQIRTRLS